MSFKSIGIIGVGGVGGYFGGQLCRRWNAASEVHVGFVARGQHLRVIQESGLLLSSEANGEVVCKPSLATDDPTLLPVLDLCLICVKAFDLPSLLPRLKEVIHPQTVVLPLLNGVDVYARVRRVIQSAIVLPACVYVGTKIERPGKVVQKGGACKILFGPDPQRPEFVPDELQAFFEQAGIKSQWTENVQSEIWQKFIFICAYGLVSAAFDKTLGEILENEALCRDVQAVTKEVISVATATGVTLPPDIAYTSIRKARSFPPDARTSFQRDFERADKPDERDLFGGAMIDLGAKCHIDVPKTKELLSRLERKKPALDRFSLVT